MRTVSTDKAPAPGGHYAQAVISGNLVFVSGQLPFDPGTGEVAAGIEEQTRQVLENVAQILEAAGSSMDRVLKTTVYITDINLWGTVNTIYSERFGAHTPARAVVPVPELHFGCLIEMEAIAATG